MGSGQRRDAAHQLRLGRRPAGQRRSLRLGSLRRRSSAPQPSRASGSCRPSTARRPGRPRRRTTRPPGAPRRLPGVRPGSGRALRRQRHLLDRAPADPEAPGHRLAALERGQLPELLVPQAEREAIRGAAPGLPRRHQGRRPERRSIILAGLFRTPRIKNGIPLDRYLPAHLPGARRSRSSTPSPCTRTQPPPGDALEAVKDTRKIMAQFKDKSTPIWITEIGWATGGRPADSAHRLAAAARRPTCARPTG